jgi:hypothetical protein
MIYTQRYFVKLIMMYSVALAVLTLAQDLHHCENLTA